MMDKDLYELAARVGQALRARGWMLATAESCTGGGIAAAITDVAGSSGWFDRGFVTYSNAAKVDLLQVGETTLASYGAVSEPTVLEMATGALAASEAQISVAVTGIAGPDGGTHDKPVGMVWFAWVTEDGAEAECCIFTGDRAAVRHQTVRHALEGLWTRLKS